MYQDETLVCRDCGKEFIFSASEQAFYAEKGFQNKPRRCPECRAAYRAQNGNGRPQREMGLRRFARTAARRRRFPSSPAATNRSIAVTALQRIAP